MKVRGSFVFLAIATCFGLASFCGSATTGEKSAHPSIAALEQEVLGLVNQARIEAGIEPLEYYPLLSEISRQHSMEMAELHYFDHISPTPGMETPLRRFLASYKKRPEQMIIGENLFYSTRIDAQRGHQRLMQSPRHRENILDDRFTRGGIGIHITADGEFYITELFCDIKE